MERNPSKSLYSYLFRPNQYSQFFELAAENLFQYVLDDDLEILGIDSDVPSDIPLDAPSAPSEKVELPPFEQVDFNAKEFDPFGFGVS